jgi:hypothetical protein
MSRIAETYDYRCDACKKLSSIEVLMDEWYLLSLSNHSEVGSPAYRVQDLCPACANEIRNLLARLHGAS